MSSDINSILVGEVWCSKNAVAKTSGNAIIPPSIVNYYLKCLTGTYADKWWNGLEWVDEEIANVMTHQMDGGWTIKFSVSPFKDGIIYYECAKESNNLHIAGGGRLLRGETVSEGTGGNIVTIIVDDGYGNLLENVLVRMTNGVESYIKYTNVNGVAVLHLDNSSWLVILTKGMCTFNPEVLEVSGDISQTYSMTVINIPASDPGMVTGYLNCYDQNGMVEKDVNVSIKLINLPGSGLSVDTKVRVAISGETGLVTFTNLILGATYKLHRGKGKWQSITISSTATSPITLPNLIGEDI
jgi:hypothetical protein